MDGLETHIEFEHLGLGDGEQALPPFLGGRDVEGVFAHLARVALDVAYGELEGSGSASSHGGQCYPCAPEQGPGGRAGAALAEPTSRISALSAHKREERVYAWGDGARQMPRAPVSRKRATAGGT
ncbi:hypothetical protein MTE01_31160 [Microbacterium testaceum]|uniref:Uncharacterized protein n=1 Tax=Microbacterium testaceum TaxID=2033 RepID=A0A4Y3QPT3_MICTE|nr:hypothetical protein MTE01_31160 [Microbacterium testaceum]